MWKRSPNYSKPAAIKCENNEGREFKKCKVRGRLKIDAAGEEGKGYVGRDLRAMVMILEVNFKDNGESL